MATAFQPPPTWALPVLTDERTGKSQFNPIWLKWFVDMAQVLSSFGGGSGSADHNLLSGLQGGASSQYYHLSLAEYTALSTVRPFAIGAIYVTVDSTNPNTTLGYGTWTQFAAGRVLVGLDSTDPDFDTVEETGGNKEVPCC